MRSFLGISGFPVCQAPEYQRAGKSDIVVGILTRHAGWAAPHRVIRPLGVNDVAPPPRNIVGRTLTAVALDPGGPQPAAGGRTYESRTMIIAKEAVIALLRERGQDARADFVDRELPDRIDSDRHGGLLATLRLNLAELAESTPQ
jgi:hypothetical protein